ncbi:unnamed protein product [Moneuplotes crassus]|uniref:Uncharacterized protein n=1 Tax=Euplotes crassus TaxID=5936 RepID=A0AAD1XHL5_EUPCR|nr:unnamed protein product [Moneuplotes crassus]
MSKKFTRPPVPSPRYESVFKLNDHGVFGKYLNKVASSAIDKSTATSGFTFSKNGSSPTVISTKLDRRKFSQPIELKLTKPLTKKNIKSSNDERIQGLLEKFQKDLKSTKRRSLEVNTKRDLPKQRTLSELRKSLPRKIVKSHNIVLSGDIRSRIRGRILFDPTQKNPQFRSCTTPRTKSFKKMGKRRKSHCCCWVF